MKQYLDILKKITKVIAYFILLLIIILSIFLVFYVMSYKIAESKGKNPYFSMFTVISHSMEPAIEANDVLLVKKVNVNKLKEGDIITFFPSTNIFANSTLTHRINKIEYMNGEIQITTKGDANKTIDAYYVYEEDVFGKVILIIPGLGKIQNFLASDGAWLFAILIPALAIISYDIVKLIKYIIIRKKNKEVSTEF